MKPIYLSEITTADGLVHQGLFFHPSSRRSTTMDGKTAKAILWVHGLTGRFYGNVEMFEPLIDECDKNGWGFAAFNNRGHDHISGMRRVDPVDPEKSTWAYGGGGNEVFEECIFDIHAGVDFLVAQGFTEVIVIGSSTGALKVIYQEGTSPHKNVTGVVLAGALSDRLGPDVDKKKLPAQIARMEKLIAEGKGDELQTGLSYFPMTPKRFVSLFKKNSIEESLVDYDDPHPKMTAYSTIKKPMLVLFSGNDENLDRPAEAVQSVFDAKTTSRKYKSIVIPGADHEFSGKEKEVTTIISSWIASI